MLNILLRYLIVKKLYMINLNFEVDQVNIFVNSIMDFAKFSASDPSRIKPCIVGATNSNKFLQFLKEGET